MEWYKIILMIVIFIFAIYLGIYVKDFNKTNIITIVGKIETSSFRMKKWDNSRTYDLIMFIGFVILILQLIYICFEIKG